MRTVIASSIEDEEQRRAFVDYLLEVRESERVSLARKIHDDLGGLLVSAAMDLSWAESHFGSVEVLQHVRRSGRSVAAAIDLKRNMIEELRPSLLDNVGLFEALRWYFKHACHRNATRCSDNYPSAEVFLAPLALSHIFRSVQILLDCTFMEAGLKSVDLQVTNGRKGLAIRIGHEHMGFEIVDVLARFRNELTSTAHRLAAFDGRLSFESRATGSEFYAEVPWESVRKP